MMKYTAGAIRLFAYLYPAILNHFVKFTSFADSWPCRPSCGYGVEWDFPIRTALVFLPGLIALQFLSYTSITKRIVEILLYIPSTALLTSTVEALTLSAGMKLYPSDR